MNFILAGANAAAGSSWIMIVAFLALIAFTYFTMMRPQKKQQQQRMAMMKALKKGDEVVMISGLYGKIDQVDEAKGIIVLDADGIYLTFGINSVREVVTQKAAAAPATNVTVAEPASEASEIKEEVKSETSESAVSTSESTSSKQN